MSGENRLHAGDGKLWDAAKELGQAVVDLETAINDFGMGATKSGLEEIGKCLQAVKKAAEDVGIPI